MAETRALNGSTARATIINATSSGDYAPMKEQLKAAELAEELYGTKVTFVQADHASFAEIVQKLTGLDSESFEASDSVNQDDASTLTLTLGRKIGVQNGKRTTRMYPSISDRGQVLQVQPSSGPGPHRSSSLRIYERRQATKELELKQHLGCSSRIRSDCSGFASTSPSISPVSPFTVSFDIFDKSSYRPISPNKSPHARPLSSTLFSPSPTQRGPQHCADGQLKVSLPSSNQTTRIDGAPHLLPLFPEIPVGARINCN